MTHNEKLKALRAYLKAKHDVNCCDATLEMFLPDYVFTDDGIFHIDELPEQKVQETEITENSTEQNDHSSEQNDHSSEQNDHSSEQNDHSSEQNDHSSEHLSKDKILSLDHFLRQNAKFTILKSCYFPDKRKWLIFGYDDNNCEQYNALILSGKDTHNLAFGTYRRCLNTYLAIEPDLAYIRQREPLKLPDLSQYYGKYYTRKQLNLFGA